MRWQSGRRSSNVEDRRGVPVRRRLGGRLGGRRGGVRIGGGLTIVILLIGLFTGTDVSGILNLLQGGGAVGGAPIGGGIGAPQISTPSGPAQPRSAAENQLADFTSVVLADTEDTWAKIFRQRGANYQPPQLVLFTDAVQSGCGVNSKEVGPFYCPADRKVYIDLSFYNDLRQRFGAPGDFAQAYVIAHEVGHHLQTLLGTSRKVHAQKRGLSQVAANQLSVKQELQADCYAGVWAHHADAQRQLLEEGDIEEGMNAAAAIGDDRLQKQARGYTNPESWTHGSSKQRVQWFTIGMKSGNMDDCDTFRGALR